jgi:hypothetical protein
MCVDMGNFMASGAVYLAGADAFSWPRWVNGQEVLVAAETNIATGEIWVSYMSGHNGLPHSDDYKQYMIMHEVSHNFLSESGSQEWMTELLTDTCFQT